MTLYLAQMNMSRGEFSPRTLARMDVDMYQAGMEEILNFIVMRQGGVIRRPGLEYMATSLQTDGTTKLLPFVFGVLADGPQSYIIELTDFKARFYNINGLITSGGVPVELVTPWAEGQLNALDYVQSADVLYVTHKRHATQKITRTSDTVWTISEYVPLDGPYLDESEGKSTTLKFMGTNDLCDKAGVATSTDAVPVEATTLAMVFDDVLTTGMRVTDTVPCYIEIDFSGAEEYICVGYSLTCRDNPKENGIYKWTFDGYDGTDWITLDSQIKDNGWQTGEKNYYPIVNRRLYRKYRLSIVSSDDVAAGDDYSIVALELTERANNSDPITVNASDTDDINDGTGFRTDDVGRVLRN
jgi:hypothetical protein